VTANPAFKVTLYLQVEHLTDGTRRLNSTLHCRSPGARPKWAKKWDRCWEFFATGDRRRKWTLTPLLLIETALQTHILSEETYGYNAEGLKSSASHAFREITLLKTKNCRICRIWQRKTIWSVSHTPGWLGLCTAHWWMCFGHMENSLHDF